MTNITNTYSSIVFVMNHMACGGYLLHKCSTFHETWWCILKGFISASDPLYIAAMSVPIDECGPAFSADGSDKSIHGWQLGYVKAWRMTFWVHG
jgi:hypothetical protein